MNISYAKVKRFSKDILGKKNNNRLPEKKIKKIKKEVKNGKTKIQIAREMNLPSRVVYHHTKDIITGYVHDTKLSGKTYELLQEIMKNGYVIPSKKYTLKNYQQLSLKFPNIK